MVLPRKTSVPWFSMLYFVVVVRFVFLHQFTSLNLWKLNQSLNDLYWRSLRWQRYFSCNEITRLNNFWNETLDSPCPLLQICPAHFVARKTNAYLTLPSISESLINLVWRLFIFIKVIQETICNIFVNVLSIINLHAINHWKEGSYLQNTYDFSS